jgi:hypothetical protein
VAAAQAYVKLADHVEHAKLADHIDSQSQDEVDERGEAY